jgi:hypothetical protein
MIAILPDPRSIPMFVAGCAADDRGPGSRRVAATIFSLQHLRKLVWRQ